MVARHGHCDEPRGITASRRRNKDFFELSLRAPCRASSASRLASFDGRAMAAAPCSACSGRKSSSPVWHLLCRSRPALACLEHACNGQCAAVGLEVTEALQFQARKQKTCPNKARQHFCSLEVGKRASTVLRYLDRRFHIWKPGVGVRRGPCNTAATRLTRPWVQS